MLFVAGSAVCTLSTSEEVMVGWRVPQAVGACVGVVLARARVRICSRAIWRRGTARSSG